MTLSNQPRHRSRRPFRIALSIVIGLSLIACSGETAVQPKTMSDALAADFKLTSSARVFFGHQSVGANIVSGIEDLQAQVGEPRIRIAKLGSIEIPDGQGIFLHTAIGQNEQPISKCQDFRRILTEDLDGRVDIALFKFCYIDFDDKSDVDAIFATYSKTMDELKQKYPNTAFIHVTTPLRSIEGGLGTWAREIMGRPNRTKLANAKRNEFNRLLRERYSTDPIFDLAASMSTYPDRRRESFRINGTVYYSMVPGYTDDGGHLNTVGRTYAAADLVHTIAETMRAASKQGGATGPMAGSAADAR